MWYNDHMESIWESRLRRACADMTVVERVYLGERVKNMPASTVDHHVKGRSTKQIRYWLNTILEEMNSED